MADISTAAGRRANSEARQRVEEAKHLLRKIAELETDEGGKGYALGLLTRVNEPGFVTERYLDQLREGVAKLEAGLPADSEVGEDEDDDPSGYSDEDIENLLSEMFEEQAPDFEANTFEHTGVMTMNRGLLIRDPESGAEWQITIVRSR